MGEEGRRGMRVALGKIESSLAREYLPIDHSAFVALQYFILLPSQMSPTLFFLFLHRAPFLRTNTRASSERSLCSVFDLDRRPNFPTSLLISIFLEACSSRGHESTILRSE